MVASERLLVSPTLLGLTDAFLGALATLIEQNSPRRHSRAQGRAGRIE